MQGSPTIAPPGTCPTCGNSIEGLLCTHCAISGALAIDATVGGAPPSGGGAGPSGGRYGRYEPIRLLGEGGFGKVYLAEQTEPIHRRVALKVLRTGTGDVAQMLARFELERQALASMNHPAICRVFDAGESDVGEPYFAMELVEGLAVNEYCARNRPSLAQFLTLFQKICAGLDHAHQRGIIHRDLKPGNIMVVEHDGEPQPVIIDFGIAKVLEPVLGNDAALTQSLQILGSPPYMSPEQAESSGGEADVRSDVYSLGAVFYEVIAGSTPILPERLQNVGISTVVRLICEEEPPPPSVRAAQATDMAESKSGRPLLPPKKIRGDLDRISLKALAKDRRFRYQSVSEFGEDLKRLSEGRPVKAGSPGFRYQAYKFIKRHPLGVGATAALAGIALVWAGAKEAQTRSEARDAERRLFHATPVTASSTIAEIQPYLGRLETNLRTVSRNKDAPLQARINSTLALAAGNDREVAHLCQLLLGEGEHTPLPGQAIAIQGGIALWPSAIPPDAIERAKQLVYNPQASREQRLCAGILLAVSQVIEADWAELGSGLARLVCGSGIGSVIRWAPAFQPAAPHLEAKLREIFISEPESLSGECAAVALATFFAEDSETLIHLASQASPAQFLPLAEAPGSRGGQAAAVAEALLAVEADDAAPPPEPELDARAQSRARCAMLLLRDGRGEAVWPLLERPDWGDPRLRQFIIHAMADHGVPASVPAARLPSAESASERAALLIALGGYRDSDIEPEFRQQLWEQAAELFRSDPSCEVHSAADWLCRKWGRAPERSIAEAKRSDTTEEAEELDGPTWIFDTTVGSDFAVFRDPAAFLIGSPDHEHGRYAHEFQHKVKIDHDFALCTMTVTRAQVEAWIPEWKQRGNEDSPDVLPLRNISLYQARILCNKLSEVAEIPEDQWCYTSGGKPKPRAGVTSLLGYRLPTEQEWEYACRGGASTPRHYGYSEELLNLYGSISDYGGALRPPGSKRPNGYGMFDMLGGVQNFIEGDFERYPGGPPLPKSLDFWRLERPDGSSISFSQANRRGQFETESAKHFRSARRIPDIQPASARSPFTGVRLARTLALTP